MNASRILTHTRHLRRRLAVAAVATLLATLPARAGARLVLDFAFAADAGEGSGHSDAYREGQGNLDAGKWRQAADVFARLAAAKGPEADAALYWQAYALGKDGRQTEALAALRELKAGYPKSTWLDDGAALEVELRGPRPAGAPAAEAGESEELKLYALNGLLQVDSARALPVLQKLLHGNASPRLKKQALFVLSQSSAPESRQMLGEIARGQDGHELQREAINMLAVGGGKASIAALSDIYRQSNDPAIKEAVLSAYLVCGAQDEVAAIARTDKDAAMRRRAIQQLGAMGAHQALRDLYAAEPAPEVRRTILQSMGVSGDVEALAQAARTDKDPELRHSAIQGLGIAGSPAAGVALRQIYAGASDVATRRAVIDGLFVSGQAHALIEIFRSEKDRELKRDIIQRLSQMDSPEASDLLMKMLEQ